jgi:glycosyltransferase involved in cell wall biosynthesis
MEAYFHKFKKSYNIADKIISPSNFMHRQLIKGGLEEDKLICLPNFIPDKLYEMQNGGFKFVRDRTVLYYGRLAAEKGIDVLLEAKKLLPGDVKLKIIGTGPEEEKLKKRVDDEAIPNIQFLGFRQGLDLYQEIKSSKCTLLPSIWNEVFGLTVIESYCLGTPVIGSDIGGIQEIIKDGRTGFLSKCNDPGDFAEKINKLLTMPQNKYEAMVLNCLEEKKRYSPQQYYHSLLGIYNSIANSNSEAQARKRG